MELGLRRILVRTPGRHRFFLGMWFSKDAERLVLASVTLGSPSDNTTPRCRFVARGGVFPLPNSQSAALGAVGRDGLAGARTLHHSQQHLSDAKGH